MKHSFTFVLLALLTACVREAPEHEGQSRAAMLKAGEDAAATAVNYLHYWQDVGALPPDEWSKTPEGTAYWKSRAHCYFDPSELIGDPGVDEPAIDPQRYPGISWLRSRAHFRSTCGEAIVGYDALLSAVREVNKLLPQDGKYQYPGASSVAITSADGSSGVVLRGSPVCADYEEERGDTCAIVDCEAANRAYFGEKRESVYAPRVNDYSRFAPFSVRGAWVSQLLDACPPETLP